jgi:hypothetical protein
MYHRIGPAAAALIASMVAVSAAAAQDRHAMECRQAYAILTHAQAGDHAWAVQVAGTCEAQGAQALASVLDEHRGDASPDSLEPVVEAAALITDRTMYEKALGIAMDHGAGTGARVQAIRIVYHQLNPGAFAPYAVFVTAPGPSMPLITPGVSTGGASRGVPLPGDVHRAVFDAMRSVAGDAAAPADVRTAAEVLEHDAEHGVLKARLCSASTSESDCDDRIERWRRKHEAP